MSYVVILLLSGLLIRNAASSLLPRPLKASGTKQLEVPSFGTYGNTRCDEDLSMYDHLATGPYRKIEILRTSPTDKEIRSIHYRQSSPTQRPLRIFPYLRTATWLYSLSCFKDQVIS